MSHVAKISVGLRDLRALAAAAPLFGMELVENQTGFKTYQREFAQAGSCEHVLKQTAPRAGGLNYEVGLKRNAEGSFDLLWDRFDHGLVNCIGQNAEKLRQEYAAAVTSQACYDQGYETRREVDADTGEIVIVASKGGF